MLASRVTSALLLLAASAGVSLCAAELALRAVAPQPASYLDIYRRHPALPFYTLQPDVVRSIDTGETRWTIRTDALGFRVGERADADANAPVVLALGDSYTFAQGVDYEESYVARLAAELQGRLRFVNAGVGGYGPVQYRQLLEYELGRGLIPAAVLVGFYVGNDFHDCVWNKDIAVVDGVAVQQQGARTWVKRRSHLYRLLARAWHLLDTEDEGGWHAGSELYLETAWREQPLARAYELARAELARIAELARERASPLLVVVIPTEAAVEAAAGRAPARSEGLELELPVSRALALLGELGIEHADATPALARALAAGDAIYFTHDGHLTGEGHRLVAELLAPALRTIPWSPRAAGDAHGAPAPGPPLGEAAESPPGS